MKKLLMLVCLCGWNCCAQSRVEFPVSLSGANVVPASPAGNVGSGRFVLDGDTLSYGFYFLPLFPNSGRLYGPAAPGMNGPALFGVPLTTTFCEPAGQGGY